MTITVVREIEKQKTAVILEYQEGVEERNLIRQAFSAPRLGKVGF